MTNSDPNTAPNPLKLLSPHGLLMLGINQIAYIRPAVANGDKRVWSLHAADGTLLSVQEHADQAIMIARTNDLAPVTVH
jgi:hypothetical protein